MAGLCCIVIKPPLTHKHTHWCTTGWGGAVKLYYKLKRREGHSQNIGPLSGFSQTVTFHLDTLECQFARKKKQKNNSNKKKNKKQPNHRDTELVRTGTLTASNQGLTKMKFMFSLLLLLFWSTILWLFLGTKLGHAVVHVATFNGPD